MCEHESREAAMVVLARDSNRKPTVWCDPCIAPLVGALNDAGIETIASCCGHNHAPGNVILADGRWLLIIPPEQVDDVYRDIHARIGCRAGRECSSCMEAK